MTRVFIGIGSNLGDRISNLVQAVDAFGSDVVAASSVYETEPIGGPAGQKDHLNAVIQLETQRNPYELLKIAQEAERGAGRVRNISNGPRTLDIDILLIEGYTSDDDELTVPHPRMWQRRFVLAPLGDLAPELVESNFMNNTVGSIRRVDSLTLQ